MKKIYKEINVPFSKEEVWQKWTTEKGIQSFFAQDCKVELKLGGAFEMYFMKDAPVGQRGSDGCKVLSFLPYEMFSFSWNAPPQFPNVRNGGGNTYVVLQFEQIDEDNTLVKLHHLGWQEGEEWSQVYDYFDKAWTSVLQWLKESKPL